MADWHAELESLLSQLQVVLDIPSRLKESPVDDSVDKDVNSSGDTGPLGELASISLETQLTDDVEVQAVKSEIAATLEHVIQLARYGVVDTTFRDDVVFVLQALTRSYPVVQTGAPANTLSDDVSHDWQLEGAAAALRFCRVVLRVLQQSDPPTNR